MTGEYLQLAENLKGMVENWEPELRLLPRDVISERRNSQGRSIKEIVGHMIDSASNNTHRIIHLQYQDSPISYPDYANLGNNDRWIAIQNYQEEDWETMIALWAAVHRHIAHVIVQSNPGLLDAIWISALGEKVSLDGMIQDFPSHFRLHIDEIEALLNRN